MGGRRCYALAGERDWIVARLAETPDVALRALVVELRGRGVTATYESLWRLLQHEGISFKKKPARQRARPA